MNESRITGTYNLERYVIDYSKPAMQVWKKLPTGFPAEVIDSVLYVSESPTTYHSNVSLKIAYTLQRYVTKHNLGIVFCPPVDVYFSKASTVVAPDICFVSKRNAGIIKEKGLYGVPDLVIEMLSPSNHRYDLSTKKATYEKYGVREYWAVNPKTKESQGFILKKGAYSAPLIMKSKVKIRILKKTFRF